MYCIVDARTIIKYYINIIHIYNVTQTPTCLILYLCKVRHGIIAALISGGGGPPSKICPHGFNFRATLLCFEDFFEKKIVLNRVTKKNCLIESQDLAVMGSQNSKLT